LFHHTGIHADTTKTEAVKALKTLREISGIPIETISQVEKAASHAQIIQTISNIGFKGGITQALERGKQDIIQFINEYITNICMNFYDTISIEMDNSIKREYIKEFSPFKMTYVIDNFISNSKKHKATKISFRFYEQEDLAILEVVDNGIGLHSSITDIESIFKRNVSTTREGAGLGLYDARSYLDEMNCQISAEKIVNGFKLKIVIPNEN
jgi:signal transduction histidine kinase